MQVAGFAGSPYEDLLTLQYLQAKPTRATLHASLFLLLFSCCITCRRTHFYSLEISILFGFPVRLAAKSASSICPLAWRRYPAASWWNALPPLPNQLVSFPSLRRGSENYGVGRRGGGASTHNAPGCGATHDPPDGRRCWRDWWA
jgi:hypothetical protein